MLQAIAAAWVIIFCSFFSFLSFFCIQVRPTPLGNEDFGWKLFVSSESGQRAKGGKSQISIYWSQESFLVPKIQAVYKAYAFEPYFLNVFIWVKY